MQEIEQTNQGIFHTDTNALISVIIQINGFTTSFHFKSSITKSWETGLEVDDGWSKATGPFVTIIEINFNPLTLYFDVVVVTCFESKCIGSGFCSHERGQSFNRKSWIKNPEPQIQVLNIKAEDILVIDRSVEIEITISDKGISTRGTKGHRADLKAADR